MAEVESSAGNTVPPGRVGREDILAALLKIFQKQTGQDGSTWNEETQLKETGISSFDAIECIFELEEEFKVDLDFNANDPKFKMETVGDLVKMFMQRLNPEPVE